MGWAIAFGLAAASLAALRFSGKCSRMALELACAALLLGLAGYAWQGSPEMTGHPAASTAR